MQIIPVGSQIDIARESRILFLTGKLHLQRKSEIILYVRIAQVFDIPVVRDRLSPLKNIIFAVGFPLISVTR